MVNVEDKSQPQSKDAILNEIEQVLNPILSPRQSIDLIEASINNVGLEDQRFALHWIKVIAVSNIELAYVFATSFGKARKKLSLKGVKVWLSESLTIYDRAGLYPAIKALQEVSTFSLRHQQQHHTCKLEEVKPKLDVIIRGLAGRDLTVKPSSEIYTDTEHLYLPKSVSRYRDKRKNQALYKSMACFLWAQNWYGTFKQKSLESLSTQAKLDSYKNPELAKHYFLSLENVRLLANIERELPGLYREMTTLSPLINPKDKTWRIITQQLKKPEAGVEETFRALDVLLKLNISIPQVDYQGSLNLTEVELVSTQRKDKIVSKINDLITNNVIDEQLLAEALANLNETTGDGDQTNAQTDLGEQEGGSGESLQNEELNQLLASLLQDIDQIDMQDITDASPSVASTSPEQLTEKPAKPLIKDFQADAYLDEWDYLRQTYREAWCRLRVKTIEPVEDNFKQQTQAKYPYLMNQIRRVFEAMRDQPKLSNKQTDGEEIDLDALVDMHTARIAGEEMSERMYIRRLHNDRNVAVCLLVDMSGSTKGWINLAMRQSLILFSEALNTLGDQYAIYGFSGLTRQRCEIYTVKTFAENNAQLVNNRISNIQAKDYTRMGFAIRYAAATLLQIQSKHRILLLLSDGKPDDYDGYQGEYGIQDTRKAILEAQGQSINPFSITIDKHAQVYLPRLFGPGQYTILNDVSLLPLKLSEIYRKLSS